jgi:hypothetical protein
MSQFPNVPLEEIAAVLTRRDPKAMAFKIALIQANVEARHFAATETGTYAYALARQKAAAAARIAKQLYEEAANQPEGEEEMALPPESLETLIILVDGKEPKDAAVFLGAFCLTDEESNYVCRGFAVQYAAKEIGITFTRQ